jgi:outer membrane lipoprotein-sorting protein
MKQNKLIPVIVILLLLLGIGGFVFMQKKALPPVSPEVRQAQQELMANCKYDVDFCKYAANGLVAMSGGYTMTSESTYAGKKSKMIMKSDGKENSQSTSFSDGKEEGSFISLNKTTYMKSPGETVWTEFPATKDETGKPTTNLFDFEGLKKELGNVKDNQKAAEETLVVKKVGTEACGTYTCTVFEMTDKTIADTSTKIWVDTTQYYARKMESKSKEGVSTMTFEYGPVTISKPSPVKKMPAFDSSVMQNTGENVNMEEIKNLMKQAPPQSGAQEPVTPIEETPAE